MAVYRCKCGKMRVTTDLRPPLCAACPVCHSALRVSGDRRRAIKPEPHKYLLALSECQYCHRTRAEIPESDDLTVITGRWPKKVRA